MSQYTDFDAAEDEMAYRKEKAARSAEWRNELANLLDRLGTVDRSKPITFNNLDELIFQLRKKS